MITIASAMQQDEIKELLEGYNEEGMTFTFKEKQGIKLFLGNSPLFSINSCLENGLKR